MFISHRRPSSRSLEKPNMPNNEEVMRVTKSFKKLQTVCKFTDRKHRSSREHGSKGDVYPAHVSWQKYYCRVEDQKIKIGTRRRSVFFWRIDAFVCRIAGKGKSKQWEMRWMHFSRTRTSIGRSKFVSTRKPAQWKANLMRFAVAHWVQCFFLHRLSFKLVSSLYFCWPAYRYNAAAQSVTIVYMTNARINSLPLRYTYICSF